MSSTDTARQQEDYAVGLAESFDFWVFPLDHPSLQRCAGIKTREHDPDSCGERGKHPTCKWSEWGTTDTERLRKPHYFGGSKPRNIGIDCGASRLLVVDEDQLDELARFCGDHGVPLPQTFSVRTGNGFHYYFRPPEGLRLGNREGAFINYGINIRGAGGFVVAPGSRHASGTVYTVQDGTREILPAPAWLIEAVQAPERQASQDGGDAAEGDQEDAWWRSGPIPEKKRHAAMIKAAGWCRRMGLRRNEAIPTMRDVFSRLEGDKYTFEQALGRLDDVYDRYAAGYRLSDLDVTLIESPTGDEDAAASGSAEGEATAPASPPPELFRRAVAAEVLRLQVREHASRELRRQSAPELPDLVRLDELLARPRLPVAYRVAEILPRYGRGVLAAKAKTGKTTFTGNLVRALADGTPFLERFDVASLEGTVALLDAELSDTMLQAWLDDQRVTSPQRVHAASLRGKTASFDLHDDHLRGQWARRLSDVGAEFAVFDCLGPMLGALGLDENSGRDVGVWLSGLEALLDEAKIAEAIVVHHFGHGAERSRGASRLRDWPDVEWSLVRQDDTDEDDEQAADGDAPRFFKAYGRDVDFSESALMFDPETRRLAIPGGAGSRKVEAVRRKTAKTIDGIVEALRIEPGLSLTQLRGRVVGSIGGKAQTVDKAVKEARARGLVKVEVDGQAHRHYLAALTPYADPVPTLSPACPPTQDRVPNDPVPMSPLRDRDRVGMHRDRAETDHPVPEERDRVDDPAASGDYQAALHLISSSLGASVVDDQPPDVRYASLDELARRAGAP